MRAIQIPPRVRVRVVERSDGLCEICARRRAVQIHHRRPRKMGGSRRPSVNSLGNLLALCACCHVEVESDRSRALSWGWLVADAIDAPASVPALLATAYGQQYVWLHNDGTTDLVDLATDLARALAHERTRE